MGKKADRQAARIAAAQARQVELLAAGAKDPLLCSALQDGRKEHPASWSKARQRAEHDAQRPSSANYQQALVALGAMQAVEAMG